MCSSSHNSLKGIHLLTHFSLKPHKAIYLAYSHSVLTIHRHTCHCSSPLSPQRGATSISDGIFLVKKGPQTNFCTIRCPAKHLRYQISLSHFRILPVSYHREDGKTNCNLLIPTNPMNQTAKSTLGWKHEAVVCSQNMRSLDGVFGHEPGALHYGRPHSSY